MTDGSLVSVETDIDCMDGVLEQHGKEDSSKKIFVLSVLDRSHRR